LNRARKIFKTQGDIRLR